MDNRVTYEELPEDYEPCDYCRFDHAYEYEEAYLWHISHPCSYCNYKNGQHEKDCCVANGQK